MKSVSFLAYFMLVLKTLVKCETIKATGVETQFENGYPRVENFHPPKGYQPVRGYEPPNYEPNINNHIIIQDTPKLVNRFDSNYFYKNDIGPNDSQMSTSNPNGNNHPLLNLNRPAFTRNPPINRPLDQPSSQTSSSTDFPTSISHRPNLPTTRNSGNGDNWRRTPLTNKISTTMRTTQSIQTTTSLSLFGTTPLGLVSTSTKELVRSSETTTLQSSVSISSSQSSNTFASTTTKNIKTSSHHVSKSKKPKKTTPTTTSTTTTSLNTDSIVSTTTVKVRKTTSRVSKQRKTTTTKSSTSTTTTTPFTTSTISITTVLQTTTVHTTKPRKTRKTKTSKAKLTTTATQSNPESKDITLSPSIRTNITIDKYANSKYRIDQNCMKCLCFIESWCADVGCVMDQGSLSCGWYQLKYEYWIDCGQPGGSWKECGNNKECAETCVRQYLTRYGPLCSTGNACADLARIHNGGPYGCSAKYTEYYGHMIGRCLKRLSPYEKIDELYKNTFPDSG